MTPENIARNVENPYARQAEIQNNAV